MVFCVDVVIRLCNNSLDTKLVSTPFWMEVNCYPLSINLFCTLRIKYLSATLWYLNCMRNHSFVYCCVFLLLRWWFKSRVSTKSKKLILKTIVWIENIIIRLTLIWVFIKNNQDLWNNLIDFGLASFRKPFFFMKFQHGIPSLNCNGSCQK